MSPAGRDGDPELAHDDPHVVSRVADADDVQGIARTQVGVDLS
jgi:hypothetical protein